MDCNMCSRGKLSIIFKDFFFENRGSSIVIQNIPHIKCDSCSRIYTPDHVIIRVTDIIRTVIKYKKDILYVQYNDNPNEMLDIRYISSEKPEKS